MKQKTGLFAGNEGLSTLAGKKLTTRGETVIFSFEAIPALPDTHVFAPGDIAAVLGFLMNEEVTHLALVGKLPPSIAFAPALHVSGKAFLAGLDEWKGETILAKLADLLTGKGFTVINLIALFAEYLADETVPTRRQPDEKEEKDIRLGAEAARIFMPHRVGQTVAVKNGMILAVEGAEGTDGMIRRVKDYCGNAVIVKIAGPNKDPRFDLPTVGPRTIEAMREAGAGILAVEAGMTVIVEREATVALCDTYNIGLTGIKPGKS